MRSQQPAEGARTQELDNWEAPENPLCPAKVHHVGGPFAAKLVEGDDSFLPASGPGEKLNTGERGHKGSDNLFANLCTALYSLRLAYVAPFGVSYWLFHPVP